MAKEKFEFYLAMAVEATQDADKFQKGLTEAYINGIEPIEWYEDTVVDEHEKVVSTVALVKCRERWKGAAKRYFRKAKFEDYGQKVHGRHVYA